MNRSFTKEYWLLLGIWAGATLLKGMSVFIDVRMPFYPWFRFSVVFGAVAFALFLLIVILSLIHIYTAATGIFRSAPSSRGRKAWLRWIG